MEMWGQQSTGSFTQCFDNNDKDCLDSAGGDSGFLSNFNSACCSSEISLNSMSDDIRPVAEEPMKGIMDSGIDLGLSDSFNQLSLKQMSFNPLDSAKIHMEPITESTSISTDSGRISMTVSEETPEETSDKSWQLYYTQNDDGDTLLHAAVIQGFFEVILRLIKAAPHPCLYDILNDDAQTALHLAVVTNQPKIVRSLVLAGADLSIRNYQGNTALHLACISGNLDCAKALTEPITTIEKTTMPEKLPTVPQNLEQRNYNGQTCLHIAASKGHIDLVSLLVNLGADLEAQESLAGRTALHLALEHGCLHVVLYLLNECRPHLDAATYSGYTAYQIASCIDESLARELVRHGATPSQQMNLDDDANPDFKELQGFAASAARA